MDQEIRIGARRCSAGRRHTERFLSRWGSIGPTWRRGRNADQPSGEPVRARDPHPGLASARAFVVCLQPSRPPGIRNDLRRLWSAGAVAGPLHSRNRGSRVPAAICRFRTPNSCCARVITARSIPTRRSMRMIARLIPGSRDICASADWNGSLWPGSRSISAFAFHAEDAHHEGFEVVVVEDACRGIDVGGSIAKTHRVLAALDIVCVPADQVGGR